MQLNILRTMPLCRGTESGSADLSDQRMEQDIPLRQNHDSDPPGADLEAHLGQEEAPLPGLIRASSHRQDDVMYLLARRFRQQAAFCLDTKANVVEQHWREIVRALERDENGTDKLQKDLFGHIKEYYELVILTYQIEGLNKPDRLLLKHFITAVKSYLKEGQASFLEATRDDWLEAYPIETLNRWLKLMPEHGTFRSICDKFRNRTTTHEHYDTHEYPDEFFGAVFVTLSHIVIVVLVGGPVVVQALDILPMVGNVVMYMVCLIFFIVFTQAFVRGEGAQFLLSLAYAAVAATNLGRGC